MQLFNRGPKLTEQNESQGHYKWDTVSLKPEFSFTLSGSCYKDKQASLPYPQPGGLQLNSYLSLEY